jgi:predicted Zn-dependent protease
MFDSIRRPLIASLLAIALLAVAPSPAAARVLSTGSVQEKESSKDKKDKKEKKDEKEDKDKQTKQEREYQKIKRFSIEKYQKEPSFRDSVEESYRQKQREHSDYAYYINTRDAEDQQVTRSGDKLKVEDTLYDNPMVQDYVNRVGQSLIPKDSTRLYAFKVMLKPVPEARSLSTGTVYVSSGLISLIDNEAQLAYVLSHEIAHIEKEHWHEDVLVQLGQEEYNEKQKEKRGLIGGIAKIGLSMATGGLANSYGAAALAAFYAELALPTILKLTIPNSVVTWDKAQEDEADQLALQYMLNRSYDPREVPKFYASLKNTSGRDRRVGLGYMADATRVVERVQQVDQLIGGLGNAFSSGGLYYGAVNLSMQRQMNAATASSQQQISAATATAQGSSGRPSDPGKTLDPARDAERRGAQAEKALSGQLSADIQAKIDAGEIIGDTAQFKAVMAELKRDNGIRAYYYDMFQMARENLQDSLMIRSNDPQAHLYYGKVLKLTARTPADKSRALSEFRQAIDLDKRLVLPESHLHRALAMMESKDVTRTRDIVESLKQYVSLFQREHGGALPPNMDVIYDYMQEAGELVWVARPATNVSTKNIDPINTSAGSGSRQAEPVQAPPETTASPAGKRRP